MLIWFELVMLALLAVWSCIDLLERAGHAQTDRKWSLMSKYTLGLVVVVVFTLVVGFGNWWITGRGDWAIAIAIVYLLILFVLSGFYSFRPLVTAHRLEKWRFGLAYIAPIIVGVEALIFIWHATHRH